MSGHPLVSIIIPMYNAGRHLPACLGSLEKSSYTNLEIIVIDDGSTDGSAMIAEAHHVNVVRLVRQSGPAAARNIGAEQARGEILFFVDSDVMIREDTVSRIVFDFARNPNLAAVFGSYDDEPAEQNFLSQYKNLYHHFVHQRAKVEATTFWAGCGAVKRSIFAKVGGFDQKRYKQPCIEDIELGCRLRNNGFTIMLDKDLQVKHLKRWSFSGLLYADIFCRAIPWTQLIFDNGELVDDLNLQISQRISAALAALAAILIVLSPLYYQLLAVLPLLVIAVCAINHQLYRFFCRKRGLRFALSAIPFHFLYYLYSGAVFASLWVIDFSAKFRRMKRQA